MFADELFSTREIPPHKDWRLPENRIEAFTRVVYTRMVEGDLDHHHSAKVIASEMGLSDEDRTIYALLFGQSYRNHWAMLTLQLFPDILNVPDEELVDWHNKHWWRMKFGNDTKWNVRQFPKFVQSMKALKKRVGSIHQYLGDISSAGNTEQNYKKLNEELKELWSMGRMTAWLAQQTLYEFFSWDIDHWDQQLYDSGTWSQYDSLCYLFNRLEIARSQKIDGKIVSYKPKPENIKEAEEMTRHLMAYLNERIPFHVDIYNVESAECEYRKTAYGPNKIKEFTFWTTNELAEQYEELKKLWHDYSGPGTPDWMPYVKAMMTKGPNVRKFGYHPSYFRVMYDHGMNLNTDILFKDEPDAHAILNLPKDVSNSVHLLQQDWDTLSQTEQEALRVKYDPVKTLRLKPKSHPAWSDTNVDLSYLNRL